MYMMDVDDFMVLAGDDRVTKLLLLWRTKHPKGCWKRQGSLRRPYSKYSHVKGIIKHVAIFSLVLQVTHPPL